MESVFTSLCGSHKINRTTYYILKINPQNKGKTMCTNPKNRRRKLKERGEKEEGGGEEAINRRER